MTMQTNLINEIMDFDIDGGPVKLTFAKRLARENLWSVPFAERVIQEYKRFVVMTMLADRQITPSEHVDQAWHLHLTYTVSYWQRMHAILPKPLHHSPTKGGQSEDDRFALQYEATLKLYAAIFGEQPPADIWPPAESRFSHDLAWTRVNLQDNFIVPKKRLLRIGLLTSILAALVVGAGCARSTAQVGGVELFFLFLGVMVIIGLFLYSLWRNRAGAVGLLGGGFAADGSDTVASDSGDGGGDGGGCGGGGCGGGD